MKLFSIGEVSGPYLEDQFWRAFWAESKQQALDMFMVEWVRDGGDDDIERLKLSVSEHELYDPPKNPKEETRMAILRGIGWHYEDDVRCENCGEWYEDKHCDCNCCELCCECTLETEDE